MAQRFPAGTPYVGPSMCYDDQIEPDQLLRRLAYGKAAPLLPHYGRMDGRFFGRLLDALSNAHVVLVKTSTAESTARSVATALKRELPAKLYDVAVDHDPEAGEWNVMAFNRIPIQMREQVTRYVSQGPVWINMREAARVLRISPSRAREVVLASPIKHRRQGARNEIMIRQRDLPILANRPRRWRKRRIA